MKILVLNWRDIKHPRAGGAEVRLHKVYEPLVAQGHAVRLISTRFDGSEEHEYINGVEVVRIGNDTNFWLLCALYLPAWEKEFNADVVVEDFNKLPFFSPWRSRKPLLIQMHHLWMGSIFKEASLPLATFVWLAEQTLRFVYRKCRFSIVSDSSKRELLTMGPRDEQVAIVYNGCDLSFYAPKDTERKPVLLWLGRIQKYKGILDTLKAFKQIVEKHPEYVLKIAGKGPFSDEAKLWVKSNGIENSVEFLGFISEEEKLDLLQTSKLVLQTSYKEGWGLTVIEANACGTPVVANHAPGLCDSVHDGETGLLYDFGSVDSLVATTLKLIEDGSLYERLAANCRPWAEKFTWKRASEETYTLLKELVEKRS